MPRLTQTIDGLARFVEVPDDANSTIAVLKESGWTEAPELVQVNPALAPGEAETQPEKPTRKAKTDTSE